MELPTDVEYIEDHHLFVGRPRGVLDESTTNKILSFVVEQEKKLGRPFDRFTDMSLLDRVELSFEYVFHVALYRRLSRVGREEIKSAFYVTDPEMARSMKLHRLMTDRSPLHVVLFQEIAAAADWLGVPLEKLEMRS
jgi:hypothetical protein